ncbi:uncharacterized protein Dmoj_GI12866, isoform A [Drosophila mojavensis]|uniref:Uncharacterized protein, isoform A n=1 Tax=Drosophila mojavensis TaxID=7230 RepID=B4KYR6_DROMO|nr:uncharacterized protein Dmoj_GI12866, isoform A [Drosophila mojavensis]
MCFLRLFILQIQTVGLCFIVLICNTCNLFYGIRFASNFDGPARNLLIVSIILDCVLFLNIFLGIYGALLHKQWPLKLYIFTLITFFISKVLIADQAVGFDTEFYYTLVNHWYHMETAFSVLCLIFAFSLYLKMDDLGDFK